MEKGRTYPVRTDVIIKWLDDNNVSQAELARHVKITPRAMSNILKGKETFEHTLTRIARAIGIKWRALIKGYEGEPEPTGSPGGINVATLITLVIELATDGKTEDEKRRIKQDVVAKIEKELKRSSENITKVQDDDENKADRIA